MSEPARPWPSETIDGAPLAPPERWGRPGLAMFFHLECAGCVGRGVPFLKRLWRERDGAFEALLIHTPHGRRPHPREAVLPELTRFARDYARLPFPVALDEDGAVAAAWGAEGTPHWLAFGADGGLERSVYGSQENAQTRLAYWLEETLGPPGSSSG